MTPYILDAFTTVPLGGNAAGVVLLEEDYPPEDDMKALAAKLGFSETAFVRPLDDGSIRLRYFTPTDEVDLCGHATVASFHLLTLHGVTQPGRSYLAHTKAADLTIDIRPDGSVWLDMAPPAELGELTDGDRAALYAMYGLTESDAGALKPAMVSSGLPDIMMPVKDRETLAALKPDMDAIAALSKKLDVTGVHVFAPGEGDVTAFVRNFAPLYGIDEEAATGTSNGALSFYLYNRGLLTPGKVNRFIQGEAMGRPSEIQSVLYDDGGKVSIRVGGHAVLRETPAE